jgi:hypothetical protein
MANKLGKIRDRLTSEMVPYVVSNMFGDGQNEEYVLDGIMYVGLNNLSDEDLVEEYASMVDDDDDLLITARALLKGASKRGGKRRSAPSARVKHVKRLARGR